LTRVNGGLIIKAMSRRGFAAPFILIVVLLLALAGGSFYLGRKTLPSVPVARPEAIISERINSLLPKGSFLRDYEKVAGITPESYLVVYVEPGYKTDLPPSGDPPYYLSCPEVSVGQGIEGTYHLALLQNGKVKNDLVIPANGKVGNRQILSYKNTKENIYGYGKVPDKEKSSLEEVKLLKMSDYTGDGKTYEFDISAPVVGCFSPARLVAGYDPDSKQAMLFSDWIAIDGSPDNNGQAHWLFGCGNHGNDLRQEKTYVFDRQTKRFRMTDEKFTACPSASSTPLPRPTTRAVTTLTYSLPSGWKTAQDKSGKIEIGYDPTQVAPGTFETRDLHIVLMPKDGGAWTTGLTLTPYDGGSRHKFINPYTWDIKLPTYHEKNYSYNGWDCLVIYGASSSQGKQINGMCAISNTQALAFDTRNDTDANVEQIIKTIRILK